MPTEMIFRWGGRSALALLSGLTACALGAQTPMPLYSGKAPGSESWSKQPLVRTEESGAKTYFNVLEPDLTYYPADPARANGAAAILLPGGGLRLLSVGDEAHDTIKRFNQEGIAVFVLKYRTLQMDPPPPRPAPSGPIKFPKMKIRNANANPSPNDARLSELLKFAIDDAQAALRMVRANAANWKIDPKRVGMVGSSAGGGVAIGAIMEQEEGATPDFFISLYGPALQDVRVPENAPPIFLATETAHGAVTDGLIALFSLWKDAEKPAELHVFEVPNFQRPASMWIDRATEWMGEQKIIPVRKD